jgi:polyphenol oxidase
MSISAPFFSSSLSLQWLRAEGWDRFPGLLHGFSGRIRDRTEIHAQCKAAHLNLYTLKQVHGDDILVIDDDTNEEEKPQADGMITSEPGLLLGIATADCVPVLLVAPQRRLVAALHAGWRGTLKGISRRAIEKFAQTWGVAPGHLWVALGPAIDVCCYEVGREVGEALQERWGTQHSPVWHPRGDKGFLDLRAINRGQCEQAGVPREQIQLVGPCTFCDASGFASYRREGPRAGRQLSVIGW